jgi:hypothetical protein
MRTPLLLQKDDVGKKRLLRQLQAARDPEQRAFLLQTLADALERPLIADDRVFCPTPSSVPRIAVSRDAA